MGLRKNFFVLSLLLASPISAPLFANWPPVSEGLWDQIREHLLDPSKSEYESLDLEQIPAWLLKGWYYALVRKHPEKKSKYERTLLELSDSKLAQVIQEQPSLPEDDDQYKKIILRLARKDTERFIRLLFFMRESPYEGKEIGIEGYAASQVLRHLVIITEQSSNQEGLKVTQESIDDQMVREVLAEVKKRDSDYAKNLEMRHEHFLKNRGRMNTIRLSGIPLRKRSMPFARTQPIEESHFVSKPVIVVKDGEFLFIPFFLKEPVVIEADRPDSVAIIIYDKQRKYSEIIIVHSHSDIPGTIDKALLLRRYHLKGGVTSNPVVTLLGGDYSHVDPLLFQLLERFRNEGIGNINLVRVPGGLNQHSFSYDPVSKKLEKDANLRDVSEKNFVIEKISLPEVVRFHPKSPSPTAWKMERVKVPNGLEELDINRDGFLSIDDFSLLDVREWIQLFESKDWMREHFIVISAMLLKLDDFTLGRIFIADFDEELRANLLAMICRAQYPLFLKMVLRMQEQPVPDQKGIPKKFEGRNAYRLLRPLAEEDREQILLNLESSEATAPYAVNIRLQLQQDGKAETTSSMKLRELEIKPIENLPRWNTSIWKMINQYIYSIKPGEIAFPADSKMKLVSPLHVDLSKKDVLILINDPAVSMKPVALLLNQEVHFNMAFTLLLHRIRGMKKGKGQSITNALSGVKILVGPDFPSSLLYAYRRRLEDEGFESKNIQIESVSTETNHVIVQPGLNDPYQLDQASVKKLISAEQPFGFQLETRATRGLNTAASQSQASLIRKIIERCVRHITTKNPANFTDRN